MSFANSELHRIAHLAACRDLSDAARSQVSTYGEEHRRAGDLVEEALQLVGHAEEVLRLAVAAERAQSTSWQEIGARLDVSRQAAHERFAGIVEEISDGVLFPAREPEREGAFGWWACPDGLEDPEATVRRLDEWAVRHREPTDPERGEHPVSGGLRRREDLARIEAVRIVSVLAQRLVSGELPAGVSERTAHRLLLERKVETFDMIAQHDSGSTARDARAHAGEAFEQLVGWHREDLDARLTAAPVDESFIEGYRFFLDERPVAQAEFTAEGSDEDTGWFLWSIDTAAFEASPEEMGRWLGEPWPVEVPGVDVGELVAAAATHDRKAIRAQATIVAQRTRSDALHAARAQLLGDLASDAAKGVDLFRRFPQGHRR